VGVSIGQLLPPLLGPSWEWWLEEEGVEVIFNVDSEQQWGLDFVNLWALHYSKTLLIQNLREQEKFFLIMKNLYNSNLFLKT
jgi:hypothetical protein